jgi:hypothetical protein
MLTRPDNDVHHIGGSPSKFQPGQRTVREDTSYADAFSAKDLATLKAIIGDAGKEWGYG